MEIAHTDCADLFGGVLLVKEWGRVGTQGRMVAGSYDNEALAAAALQRHAESKRRKMFSSFGRLSRLAIGPKGHA
jgi:predicted DNA-binding WGR domain protein